MLKGGKPLRLQSAFLWQSCPSTGLTSAQIRARPAPLKTHERRQRCITKIHANLVIQACIWFLRCFRTPGAPISKILAYTDMLPGTLSCPLIASSYANLHRIPISFWKLTIPWSFFLNLSRFTVVHLVFEALGPKLAHIHMPLLTWFQGISTGFLPDLTGFNRTLTGIWLKAKQLEWRHLLYRGAPNLLRTKAILKKKYLW